MLCDQQEPLSAGMYLSYRKAFLSTSHKPLTYLLMAKHIYFCFGKREQRRFHKLLKRKTKHFCNLLSGSVCGNMFYIFWFLPIGASEWFPRTNKLSQHPQKQTVYCSQMNNRCLTGSVSALCLQSESVDEQEYASKNLPILTTSSFSRMVPYFGLLVWSLWNNPERLTFSFRQIRIRRNK